MNDISYAICGLCDRAVDVDKATLFESEDVSPCYACDVCIQSCADENIYNSDDWKECKKEVKND